jgi:hypothetical protein
MNRIKKNKKTSVKLESLSFEDYLSIEKNNSANYKKKKVILTITIDEESCRKLKRLIPEGEVSKFANKIIMDGIRKIEEKVFREYNKIGQDQELNEQIKKLSIS